MFYPSRSSKELPGRLGIWLLAAGVLLSCLLGYVAIQNYLSALPVAAGSLRGLALSLSETIESLVVKDPSMALLRGLKSPDMAFFAVFDSNGVQIFHTNPDLIGSHVEDQYLAPDLGAKGFSEKRIILGTGEDVFEFIAPLHLPGKALKLRLVLHAYRADAIVHRAQSGLTVIFLLLLAGWVMGILLYRFSIREERHRLDMATRENLARLGAMGAVLAHEVRSPLSGIKGYAQLLEEQLLDAESREYAGYIVTEAVRLEGLVNDLLVFVRTESLDLTALAVDEVVSQAIGLINAAAAESGIEVVRSIGANLIAKVNRDRLEQVVLNLLQNAIQAMPAGGVLAIGADREAHHIHITISDTGQGINRSDQELIFEPFFTTKARGSGLGLAISKKYIEEMNGTISVSSRQGNGSVFRVSLPAVKC